MTANNSTTARSNGGLRKKKRHYDMCSNSLLVPFCMVICTLVGYLFGSGFNFSAKYKNTIIADNREIKTKISSNTNNSVVTSGMAATSNYLQHQQQRQKANSIIEEIIPPQLLPTYAHEKLQFNITRSMLRQSRPVVGNTERLHLYLQKLQAKKCTTVLFLGGSVTAGHNGGGPDNAYPRRFIDWLNARYPCKANSSSSSSKNNNNETAAVGKHKYRKTHAVDSVTHFMFWQTVTSVEEFDLVLIEFNIGDSFVKGLPHALEDKGSAGNLREYQGSWYFEVLLRRLLLLKKPDPVAIVTFNADYIGRMWAFPPYQEPSAARQMLFRNNQEPLKIWVSSMYEIPVFSAVIWMLPLAGKRGLYWQFNRTANPYNTAAWHADACCHPKPSGHLVLSLVLAHCILEEEKIMLSYSDQDTAYGQRDFTMDNPPSMREPLYLSPDEDNTFVMNNSTSAGGFDFTDPDGEKSWKKSIVSNTGWSWYADNKDKDKFGYIADGVEGGQHIAIALSGGEYGKVEISFVVSYENFGIANSWVDESAENVHEGGLCNGQEKKADPNPQQLSAIWDQPVSVPKVEVLDNKLKAGENKTLHICLTPRDEKQKGTENKFKLLGVRVY